MLVKNWMSKNVITIDADGTMQEAVRLLKEHNIRRLPVMRKGKLVGILTDRDLKEASASDATKLEIHELLYLLSKIKIREIMTEKVITVHPNQTVEEVAQILLENKISGVPVMDENNQIEGIITQSDIFRVLISLTGIGSRGIQFAFLLEDHPGAIQEVEKIIRKYGGRMISLLSSNKGVVKGYRKVFIRMYEVERSRLMDLKKELKGKAVLLYLIDHRNNEREVFDKDYKDFMKNFTHQIL